MSENEKTTYVAYLRQSTKKQEISGLGIEAQREIIGRYLGQEKPIAEFVETESGKKTDRPKLTEALALCRKTGSTLIVAKLDRLSRNVAFTSKLLESDVEIKFCDFPEANRLVLHIIASIAEYEAGLISQRTKQSLEAKRQRGITLGKSQNTISMPESKSWLVKVTFLDSRSSLATISVDPVFLHSAKASVNLGRSVFLPDSVSTNSAIGFS